MIGQTAPCWDKKNKIIWVAHLLQKFLEIVSLIPTSTVQNLPLHHYSLLEIGVWLISIHIYLICIFVVNGSNLPKIQRSLERGANGIAHFVWNGASFQPEAKMTKWILNCIFPCDGVEYWYQEWLWWLGSIHRVHICVCQFNWQKSCQNGGFQL